MRHLCILYNVSANPETIISKASEAFKDICSDELVIVKDLNQILHGSQGLNFDNITLITKGILDTEEEYFKTSFIELINNAVPNVTVSFWEVVNEGKVPTLENLYSSLLSVYPVLKYHKLVKLTVQLIPKCILGNDNKNNSYTANVVSNAVAMTQEPVLMTMTQEPVPMTMTPEPMPMPMTPEPMPMVMEPEPIPMTPEPMPIVMEPEPEPMPMVMEPEPEPMPITMEPEPAPITMKPEPMPITMEPEPAPVVMEPEPMPMTPEPMPMEPEPMPMVPEPTPVVDSSFDSAIASLLEEDDEPAPVPASPNLREDVSPDLDIMSLFNNPSPASLNYDDYDEDEDYVSEPEPTPEPVPVTPTPVVTTPEPVPVVPEPVPVVPEPVPVTPTPVIPTPEPVPVTQVSEPVPVAPTPEPVPVAPTPTQERSKGVFGRFKRKTRERQVEASAVNITGVPQPIHQEERFLTPEYTPPVETPNNLSFNRTVSVPFLKEPKVIFVTSGKSMGASTIAANLALTISSALNFSTLLIDADLKNRMQSNIFSKESATDIKKQNSLVSLLSEQGHSRVERYALNPWANLHVLCGSYNGDSAILNNKQDLTEINPSDLQSIVFPALTRYRAIIVDMPWSYILKYPNCVQMANKILYITSGDYSGIIDIDTNVNSKFFENEYTDYIPVVQRISFVLNKWTPNTLGVLNGKQFRMTPEVFIKVLQNFIDMENDPIMLTRAVGSIPYFDQMPNTLLNSIPVTMIAENDPVDGKCIGNKYLQHFLQILLNL